jgi:hypothetical protein
MPSPFRGSFENDIHPPLAVTRWSAVGPGSIEIAHFAKVAGFIGACIWLIAQSPLTIMAALPEIEAAGRFEVGSRFRCRSEGLAAPGPASGIA